MKTTDEIITIFTEPLTTFKHGRILQRSILSAAAGTEYLAAFRSLSLLQPTELRILFLEIYESVEMDKDTKVLCADIVSISDALKDINKSINKAINELDTFIPRETLDVLKDMLVVASPQYYIVVATFTIISMTLREEGIL